MPLTLDQMATTKKMSLDQMAAVKKQPQTLEEMSTAPKPISMSAITDTSTAPIVSEKTKPTRTLPSPVFPKGTPRDIRPPEVGLWRDLGDVGTLVKEIVAPTTPYTQAESDKLASELVPRIAYWGKYLGTLGGRIGPKGLQEELQKEAEQFAGFGPALMPLAGGTAELALMWGFVYPKLFKAAGFAGSQIAKIPKIAQGVKALKSMGGIAKVAEKHPHLYSGATKAISAFAKGEAVGQTMAAVESLGKDKPLEQWVIDMNKRGALLGGVATVFSVAHSIDQYRYITQLGRELRLAGYNRHVERIKKGMLPKHSADLAKQEGKKIEDIIWYHEQQMLGAPTELYGGKKPELSPQEAAQTLAKKGFILGEMGKSQRQLRQIKKPSKPSDILLRPEKFPKGGKIVTAPKNTYQEAYNPKTGQRVVIPEGMRVAVPKGFIVSEPISLKAPPPIEQAEIDARQAADVARMDEELAKIQRQPRVTPPAKPAAVEKVGLKPKKGVIIPPKPTQAKPEAKAPEIAEKPKAIPEHRLTKEGRVIIETDIGEVQIPEKMLTGKYGDDLETIFYYGNFQSDVPQPNLERSLSVGDTIKYRDHTMMIMSFGWRDVTGLSDEAIEAIQTSPNAMPTVGEWKAAEVRLKKMKRGIAEKEAKKVAKKPAKEAISKIAKTTKGYTWVKRGRDWYRQSETLEGKQYEEKIELAPQKRKYLERIARPVEKAAAPVAEKPPTKITSGYPPVEYKFTGRWSKQQQGFYKATRNKRIVKVPIYRSAQGKEILNMPAAVEISKPPAAPVAKKPAKEAWEMTREQYFEQEWFAKLPADRQERVRQLWEGKYEEAPHVETAAFENVKDQKEAEHTQKIQQALAEGKPVPREVLEEYKSEKWAAEALGKKKISAREEFKVGDIINTKGHSNMADPITIRTIKGNTLKFTDAKGVEYAGMARATVRRLIKGGSWERAKPAPAKVVEKKEVKHEEAITEPVPGPKVEPRPAEKIIPTGKLDPTKPEDAKKIIKKHKDSGGGVGGIFETKWDSEAIGVEGRKGDLVIESVEYTSKQVDTAYRTVQKSIPSPMPDVELFAMPGKEKQLEAIAQKMQKVKGVSRKTTRKARPSKPPVLPKAKTSPADHIKEIYKAAAKETTRYGISGVKVEGDDIVATDGRRLFWAKGKWGKDGLYLDTASLKNGLLGKPYTGKPEKTGVKFPNWRDIVPDVSGEKPIYVEAEALWYQVRRAQLMTSPEAPAITVIANKDGSLGFAAASPEIGHAEINVQSGGRILGGVNPEYLLDAIKFHAIRGNKEFEFYFPDWDRPILTRSFDGKTNTLTMPINVGEGRPSEAIRRAMGERPTKKLKPPKEVRELKELGGVQQEPANVLQKVRAYEIAEEKGLINKKGKPTQSFRRFARAMTGKTSIDKMAEEEAAYFIDMLDALVTDYRGIARIPTSKHIITKELADKIGKFKNIGVLERIRPAWRVFEKMGLYKEVFEPAFEAEISSMEELFDFRDQAKQMRKLVGKETSRKLFRAIENPGKIKLTENEQKVVNWGKKHFRDWADRLRLTPEQRRKNYITHIFEKDIAGLLKEKHPLDPDLMRALEFITPKTVFNPYLQRRLGKTVGLKENFWSAIEAYEYRAIKKFYYEPLIKRLRVYQRFLPPNSARYLRNYITRITNRPLVIDREVNQTLKEVAAEIEKLPVGKYLARPLTKGNAAGIMAYNMTGLYYECWLGLRPASAIKNLTQHGLILAETGPVAFTKSLKTVGTQRARLLANSKVLRSRKLGYLPGIDQTFIQGLESKRRKITMAMFRAADRKNVSDAFIAGYLEAKAKGLPDSWAYKRGDEVAAKTQWLYSKLAGPQWTQTSPGRVLGVLTTWPQNWAELMNDWIRAKPSRVYTDYAKETGKEIPKVNWAKRRKSLWTYLSLVSLAMLIHKKTPFKALYYTGWTSIKSLMDIASGKLAGLEIFRIVGNLIIGLAMLDKKYVKKAWNEAKRFIVIGKELYDIISGKKDWLNLFIYLETKKDKGQKRPTRPTRPTRKRLR